jgi:GH15 family glucan-1,4-alpha-glucosidase
MLTFAPGVMSAQQASWSQQATQTGIRELSRPARPWEFLDAVGKHSALLGNEAGRFEAWVYPLKILREFDLQFILSDRTVPASSFVRRVTMRPEGPTLTFSSDSYSVDETWLAPPDENGAIVRFDISTWEPLDIEVSFTRDFQLMWPAAIGGTYMSWNADLHAFTMGEESRKFAAVVGSPSAVNAEPEFFSNSYSTTQSSFRLGSVSKGKTTKYLFIAGSTSGPDDALKEYRRLAASPEEFFAGARKYYDDYLARTVSLELPDPKLQEAYDWSRISMVQGMVTNPYLGTGLIAGYRGSGNSARPGFAWFFGRDSLWTDLALDSIGDFADARTALDFIAKYQRQDGKVEHEIAQTASLVDWFNKFQYGFASADATPLFIIAMNDYVSSSGDTDFAKQRWDNVWRAYQFLKSTYDANGLPKNFGVGHGWIEGGPLLPVETESYQSGLAAEALRALASLARVAGKNNDATQLQSEFDAQQKKVNTAFWDASHHYLSFALDRDNKTVATPTVLTTAAMWFGVFDEAKANATIDQIAGPEHSADWGMRIISDQNPLYGPTGYHFGSVWPLFTGWAAVGEYGYHRPLEAYTNLRANSLLALDGSLGRVTEVLSGSYYEGLGTASPHQIWSSAMVISPILRGMLGLSIDQTRGTLSLAPHLPADWNYVAIRHLPFCGTTSDLVMRRSAESLQLSITTKASADCTIDFSPGFSKHAHVLGATLNNHKVAYKIEQTDNDQHARVAVKLASGDLAISLRDDFGTVAGEDLPPLGSESRNLKISHEQWSGDGRMLTLSVAGVNGSNYTLKLYGAHVSSVDGGSLSGTNEPQVVAVDFPSNGKVEKYESKQLTLRF